MAMHFSLAASAPATRRSMFFSPQHLARKLYMSIPFRNSLYRSPWAWRGRWWRMIQRMMMMISLLVMMLFVTLMMIQLLVRVLVI